MNRILPLLCAITFGLMLVFSNGHEIVRAQTPRNDTIRLMATTRGSNIGGVLKWCVSQSWHRGNPQTSLPLGLDMVPQGTGECPSLQTEMVELPAYGLTTDTSCTSSSPCPSVYVQITIGVTDGNCDYIKAELIDWKDVNTRSVPATGNKRGTQRMLHASAPPPFAYDFPLRVSSGTWYSSGDNWRTVGQVTNDTNCMTTGNPNANPPIPPQPGFTDYHVHQDFLPPTTSVNCQWNKNTATPFANGDKDQRRDDPNIWYIFSITHKPGLSCIPLPGQKSADHLLRIGGELDGPTPNSGQGARSLTTGTTITAASTCFDGTSWCGTMTVTQPLLRAAKSYDQGWPPLVYLRGQQQSLPPAGVDRYWYGPDAQGYVFWVRFADIVYRTTVISCSDLVYAGERFIT